MTMMGGMNMDGPITFNTNKPYGVGQIDQIDVEVKKVRIGK